MKKGKWNSDMDEMSGVRLEYGMEVTVDKGSELHRGVVVGG